MCLTDLLARLSNRGVEITEPQVRWAIKTGRISRPQLDGSLRFDFGDEHVSQLESLIRAKEKKTD